MLPEEYLTTFAPVAERFVHCVSVSAIHLQDQPIVYVNRQFEAETGYSRSDVLGRNCRFLQGERNDQPGRYRIARAIAEGASVFEDLINFRADGSSFINRLVLIPFDYISTSDERYYIGIQRVLEMTDESGLTEFVPRHGEIQHEVNNPLAVALGFAELGPDHPRAREAIDTAIARIERYVDGIAAH